MTTVISAFETRASASAKYIASRAFFVAENASTIRYIRERIKPVVDFLYSKDVAETIYVDGKFPSTNPALDNRLTSDQKFVWIGWDVIHHEDVGKLLRDAEAAFFNQSNRTILKIGARR